MSALPLTAGQAGLIPTESLGAQAQSREELQAFGLLFEAESPSEVLARVDSFVSAFPASEFLALARLREMNAHIQLNRLAEAERAARQTLEIDPSRHEALLALAEVLANRTVPAPDQQKALLDEAVQLADHGLRQVRRLRAPPSVDAAKGLEARKLYLAQGLETLGLIAMKRGNFDEAVGRLEEAVELAPSGRAYYRLGIAYQAAHQQDRAIAALRLAQTLGPDSVVQMAQQLLSASEDLR